MINIQTLKIGDPVWFVNDSSIQELQVSQVYPGVGFRVKKGIVAADCSQAYFQTKIEATVQHARNSLNRAERLVAEAVEICRQIGLRLDACGGIR